MSAHCRRHGFALPLRHGIGKGARLEVQLQVSARAHRGAARPVERADHLLSNQGFWNVNTGQDKKQDPKEKTAK